MEMLGDAALLAFILLPMPKPHILSTVEVEFDE